MIWEKLIECQHKIIEKFENNCSEYAEDGLGDYNQPENGWVNRTWNSDSIRRAHIDVVDAREQRGLWMMHVCVFPQLHNDAPIYGFDVIAGATKMTGAFHDYSRSVNPDHVMMQGYAESVKNFIPEKKRELPEWARNIFSSNMLAAGNVKTEEEATEIIRLALDNLDAYLAEVPEFNHTADESACADAQNYYCENQQMNPHTPRTMKSLGLPEEEVDKFCRDMLFPKLQQRTL
jgi:hypothetical protein